MAFSFNYQTLDVDRRATAPNIISTLKGDANEIGYVLSFQKQYGATTLGFSHRSETTYDVTGTQSFSTNDSPNHQGTLSEVVDATATFGLPSITALGLAHQATDNTSHYADVTFTAGQIMSVETHRQIRTTATRRYDLQPSDYNYKDTLSFAVGMDHDYGNGLTVRAGVHYDPTPTVDAYCSTSTPDGDLTWLATGFSKEMNEARTIDGLLPTSW